MKTNLRLLLSGIMLGGVLFVCSSANAQIDYSENFDGEIDWELIDFYEDEDAYEIPCAGTDALFTNLYDLGFFGTYEAEMVSPSIGTSDGNPVILSYQYKLLDYNDGETPVNPTQNEGDWGFFTVYYATSSDGPWTAIETVNPQNHTEAASCATRTVIFTPPMDADIYLRIYAELGDSSNDFLIYIDEITAEQTEDVDCDGAPAAATATASLSEACLNDNVTLSFTPGYLVQGLSYQWQSSTNGTDFEDVAIGGDMPTYTTMQSADMWYRVMVTCDESGESTPSSSVLVESTGQLCYCEMNFTGQVEPITFVSFAGLENESDPEVDGSPANEDFTELEPAEVELGETYEITLEGNTNDSSEIGYENYFAVYIDFNQDGDFTDDGELLEMGFITGSTGEDGVELTGDITIPEDAMVGTTRMRIVKHWYDPELEFPAYLDEPCGDENNEYGQAEDYLINISAPAEMPTFDYYNLQWPATATITQGESATVYAQAYEPEVTPGAGAGEGVMAWIGVSTEDTDPATWDEEAWMVSEYNAASDGNNDEFMLAIGADLPVGTYYYAARWQLEDGPYSYGGFQGAWGEEGVVNGVLTVNCAEIDVPDTEGTMQTFCGDAEAGDLDADANMEGGEVVWYDAETEGNALTEDYELEDGMVYYVAQVVGSCESARVGITVEITEVEEPLAESPQVFEGEPGFTVINLYEEVEVDAGGTITWYTTEEDAEDGANPIDVNDMVSEGIYYVTQTIDGCESDPTAVEVQMVLDVKGFAGGTFTYYPNPVKDVLTLSYTEVITHVEVFNMLGQKVMDTAPGQDSALIDLSSLANAAYTVKVSAGETSKTIKIIKQ